MERSSSRRVSSAFSGNFRQAPEEMQDMFMQDFFQLSQGFGQVLLLKGLGFAVEQLVAPARRTSMPWKPRSLAMEYTSDQPNSGQPKVENASFILDFLSDFCLY